jgi:cytochrome c-type biogenesis protein CcmE
MKPKARRLWLVLISLGVLGGAVALILMALEENIVFFYSPTELAEKDIDRGRRLRIGGLVEDGSVVRGGADGWVEFRVTDLVESVPVRYKGLLPDLFREGQGVVAEGVLRADGTFEASTVLAKHDEAYMPPEVAEALKKSGQWQGAQEDIAREDIE